MGKRETSGILGGCFVGTLGGLVGMVLGGWIAFTLVSTEVKVPKIGEPHVPFLLLMQIYMLAYGAPVILGAIAGGIVVALGGSLIGAVIYSKLYANPIVTADDADIQYSQGKLGWVYCAIYGMVAIGLLGVVISALLLFMEEDRRQPTAFMLWAFLGIASGVLLSKRVRAGQVLGVVFVLPGLLVLPYGALITLILLYALCCDQTNRYLAKHSR